MRLRIRALAVLLVALPACMFGGGPASKGEIDIAADLPLTGAVASAGHTTELGAAFAVTRVGTLRGYTLKFVPYNDVVTDLPDSRRGSANVSAMIKSPAILGMVGPFNDDVAVAEIPVANRASLAMVSPRNTNPCLTLPLAYCQGEYSFTAESLRPSGSNNYFRLSANDTYQGPAMADFASGVLHVTKAAVWDDSSTFGKEVADDFAREFKAKSGSVVLRNSFNTASRPDFNGWLNQAARASAQAIYAGATSSSYACLARGSSQGILSPSVYYLAPDGAGDGQCISDAGSMANDHMYVTQAIGDAHFNPSAAPILAAYAKVHPNPADTSPFTFAGYDCAALLLDAIGRAIDANGGKLPTRAQVLTQLSLTTSFKGLTGTFGLDPHGDPQPASLQVQQLQSGAWTAYQNITYPGGGQAVTP